MIGKTDSSWANKESVNKNNSLIRNIVDLEREKNKLKWKFTKPTHTLYFPSTNRMDLTKFEPQKTIVPLAMKEYQKEAKGINITSKEILGNNRDVDTKQDKRRSIKTNLTHKSKDGSERMTSFGRRTSNITSEGRRVSSCANNYEDKKNSTGISFFLTNPHGGNL